MAKPFWRNVLLVALAHVALVAGLIRWSVAAKPSAEPENIMWLREAADVAAGEQENNASPAKTHASMSPVEPEASKDDEAEEEKTATTASKSEIELPSPTPKNTPRATPAPKSSATPKPRRTQRPIPEPTGKRTLMGNSSAKSSPKPKPPSNQTNKKLEKSDKKPLAEIQPGPQKGGVSKTGATRKGGSAGGGSDASEFAWYGNMLHDRFYRAWIQPTRNNSAGTKISTLVKVRIEKDGRVSGFEIVKPSGDSVVNESVRVVAKQVTHVDPPPTGLFKGDHYDVRINFELNTAGSGK